MIIDEKPELISGQMVFKHYRKNRKQNATKIESKIPQK